MVRIPATTSTDRSMSTLDNLLRDFSQDSADVWLRQLFDSYDASMRSELSLGSNKNEKEYFDKAVLMGFIKELPKEPHVTANCPVIVVNVSMRHDLAGRDSRVAQFNLAKRIIKEAVASPYPGIHGLPSQGLFFFHDGHRHFRLSLVSGNIEKKRFVFNSAKRQSFFVNEVGSNPTIRRRFNTKIKTLADLKEVFSVEALTKAFYKSLFDWYIWATEKDKTITFPNDLSIESDDRDYLEPAVIRLLTRLMFVWFIKQKGLVPDELFDVNKLGAYIKEFDAYSKEQDNYYRVVLQNLFFATLNCKPEKRKFKRIYRGMSHERGIATCYRYVDEMPDESAFKELMSKVPFLNCALFDCLDKKEREQDGGRELYLDGFSDRKERRAHIHNAFFFDEHQGLIPLFNQYEFTVDENSTTDTDVALDPELLGKVFENLLGSYNPETKETARKATGSFYTPREIVNYMVRESLKSYLHRKCPFADDVRLGDLFDESKTDPMTCFSPDQKEKLLDAIYTCKILDPACGSGAFPMGVLHTMVRILDRLDKNNLILRKRLLDQYKADRTIIIAGLTEAEQQERMEMLDKQFRENISFPDYARKLYLIENCIYGIDIQPIATQISKLRFFISLLCDQLRMAWNPEADNHGLLSLPNLETKFVCADSLLSLPKLSGDSLAMSTANIQELKQKLESNRHLVFTARTIETKNKYKAREREIRDEIRDSIRQSLSTPDNKLIATLEAQLPPLYKQLADVTDPKMELREDSERVDLFSPSQPVIREIDVNEAPRAQIKARIANIERAIETEKSKAQQSGSTELDRLALAVSGWDPYDQNACSDFFDASWMFNIDDGFDIVIGNPPYIQLQKGKHGRSYENCNYKTFTPKGDIYCLFYEQGWNLLREKGLLCYITSNKWMRAGYGASLRDFLGTRTNPLALVDCSGYQVFKEATVDTNILLFSKESNMGQTEGVILPREGAENLSDYVQQNHVFCNFSSSESWIILSPIEQSIKRKIEAVGKPLKNWEGIKINYGIKTGCDEAFIINTQVRNNILQSCADKNERTRTEELIRPILRGRDIKRYEYNWENLWLINMHNGIKGKIPRVDVNNYPAVKAHLDHFLNSLSKRTDRGDTLYNLRNCAYMEDFYKPKIVYPETTLGAYFSYDTKGFYLNKTCFMMLIEEPEYVLETLSSKLFEFAYKRLFSSIQLGGKGYQYNKHALTKLPVIRDNSGWYRHAEDSFFYNLYNISRKEIDYIEHYLSDN